ncbi:hypothetical protein AG1IA_03668 [Rhizoctonia solani AG-1 IA]|uniref:Uncharacterized protein n=1 Tax=Thanatephorus cucumeris (strain AG1-IA) TaxID=983506 RepID=L8WW64_THACA|nr:hypothetical protein AG1IA_03668 [Rhizoctonia solani AG-1 IA]
MADQKKIEPKTEKELETMFSAIMAIEVKESKIEVEDSDAGDSDVEDSDEPTNTDAEYAYLIVMPNPFEKNRGITRDTVRVVHYTRIHCSIDRSRTSTERARHRLEPTILGQNRRWFQHFGSCQTIRQPYISIIKLNCANRRKRKKPGKILEKACLGAHRCAEWRGLYSKEDQTTDGTTRQGLQNLLRGFFPLSDMLDRKPNDESGKKWRARLKVYLENNEKAQEWTDVLKFIQDTVNPGKGSVGTKSGNKVEKFPRMYILATPSTRKESRYLGIDDRSCLISRTYYFPEPGARLDTCNDSFNGYLLDEELDANKEQEKIKKIWDDLEKVLLSKYGLDAPTRKTNTDWYLITIKGSGQTRSPAIDFLDSYITTFHETKGIPCEVEVHAPSDNTPQKEKKLKLSALKQKVKWKEDQMKLNIERNVRKDLSAQEDNDPVEGYCGDVGDATEDVIEGWIEKKMELLRE